MNRTLLAGLGAVAATVATVAIAAPAQAASKEIVLRGPSGAIHSVLSWNDTYDNLCLTLRSTAAGASADADMRLNDGSHAHHLRVTRTNTQDCTGNLSIPEDRGAQMRLYGGTYEWSNTTGWVPFVT